MKANFGEFWRVLGKVRRRILGSFGWKKCWKKFWEVRGLWVGSRGALLMTQESSVCHDLVYPIPIL